MNEMSKRPQQNNSTVMTPSVLTPSTPSSAATTYFLRIHLYSTLEVKQTTTVQMPSNLLMSEVFAQICQKRKYDTKDYVLKMPDTKTDVPLDKTLAELKVQEFCVLKRDRGGGKSFLKTAPKSSSSSNNNNKNIYSAFFLFF